MTASKDLVPIVVGDDGLYLDMTRLRKRWAEQAVVSCPGIGKEVVPLGSPWTSDDNLTEALAEALDRGAKAAVEVAEALFDKTLREAAKGNASFDDLLEATEGWLDALEASPLLMGQELPYTVIAYIKRLRSLGLPVKHVAQGILSQQLAGEELAWWYENRRNLGSLSAPEGSLFSPEPVQGLESFDVGEWVAHEDSPNFMAHQPPLEVPVQLSDAQGPPLHPVNALLQHDLDPEVKTRAIEQILWAGIGDGWMQTNDPVETVRRFPKAALGALIDHVRDKGVDETLHVYYGDDPADLGRHAFAKAVLEQLVHGGPV